MNAHDAVVVGGDEGGAASTHGQHRFGHVAQLGRERFILELVGIGQLAAVSAFVRIQRRVLGIVLPFKINTHK